MLFNIYCFALRKDNFYNAKVILLHYKRIAFELHLLKC